MQNIYQYTKYFQPSVVYDKSFTQKMITGLDNLGIALKTNPPDWDVIFTNPILWAPPYHKPYQNKYNNIIYIFAKLIRVKIMFKDILVRPSIEPKKALLIIGDYERSRIMEYLLNHYFKGLFSYEQWIKNNLKEEASGQGINDIRIYASKLIEQQLDILYIYTKEILDIDKKYEHRLENFILFQLNLDFKKYHTHKPTYDHAVSNEYYHRRMLL